MGSEMCIRDSGMTSTLGSPLGAHRFADQEIEEMRGVLMLGDLAAGHLAVGFKRDSIPPGLLAGQGRSRRDRSDEPPVRQHLNSMDGQHTFRRHGEPLPEREAIALLSMQSRMESLEFRYVSADNANHGAILPQQAPNYTDRQHPPEQIRQVCGWVIMTSR